MNPDVQRIVDFWFTRPPMEWIVAPEGLDARIKDDFGALVHRARAHELDDWAAAPEAEPSLALVVLLDQFSRNLFRGQSGVFDGDAQAWEVATDAVARGLDKQVSVIQATAFYMPLMQKESIISLVAARALFEGLKSRCETEEEHRWVDLAITASGRHMSQLRQFGRYPTRNAVLGRENTEAEEEFLKQHVAAL